MPTLPLALHVLLRTQLLFCRLVGHDVLWSRLLLLMVYLASTLGRRPRTSPRTALGVLVLAARRPPSSRLLCSRSELPDCWFAAARCLELVLVVLACRRLLLDVFPFVALLLVLRNGSDRAIV